MPALAEKCGKVSRERKFVRSSTDCSGGRGTLYRESESCKERESRDRDPGNIALHMEEVNRNTI